MVVCTTSNDHAGQSKVSYSHHNVQPFIITGWLAADLGEEGLLLDALAVVAQPLAALVGAISTEGCRAAGISPDQLTLRLDRLPYQLQLQLHQVCHQLACSACCIIRPYRDSQDRQLLHYNVCACPAHT